MSRITSKNTKPEIRVRSLLHSMGFRFRLHGRGLPGRPDIVLAKYKTVFFGHGDFGIATAVVGIAPRRRIVKPQRGALTQPMANGLGLVDPRCSGGCRSALNWICPRSIVSISRRDGARGDLDRAEISWANKVVWIRMLKASRGQGIYRASELNHGIGL